MEGQENNGAQANNGVFVNRGFKPYGSPPAFDLDEHKGESSGKAVGSVFSIVDD